MLAIKNYGPLSSFRDLYTAFLLFLTIPVTVAKAERTFSKLKLIRHISGTLCRRTGFPDWQFCRLKTQKRRSWTSTKWWTIFVDWRRGECSSNIVLTVASAYSAAELFWNFASLLDYNRNSRWWNSVQLGWFSTCISHYLIINWVIQVSCVIAYYLMIKLCYFHTIHMKLFSHTNDTMDPPPSRLHPFFRTRVPGDLWPPLNIVDKN